MQIGKAFPLFAQSKRANAALHPHLPARLPACAASVGPVPARHAVCTPPSSPRSRTRLAARAPNLLLLQSRPPASWRFAPWRRLHLRKWHPECRPASPWAVRTARCSLACMLAACPSAHEHTLYAHANMAQPGSRARSCFIKRDLLCVVVWCHTWSCTSPRSYFQRTALACLQAACDPCEPDN